MLILKVTCWGFICRSTTCPHSIPHDVITCWDGECTQWWKFGDCPGIWKHCSYVATIFYYLFRMFGLKLPKKRG